MSRRFPLAAAWLCLLWALLAHPAVAHADSVTVSHDAELHEKAGESSKVVGAVAEGDKVVVLARSGRWLKVRTPGKDGVIGWITRSNVEEKVVPRNTRRRPSLDSNSAWTQKQDRVGGDVVSEAERERQARLERQGSSRGDDIGDGSDGGDGDDRRRDRDDDGPQSLAECRDAAESIEDYDDCEDMVPRRKRAALRKGDLAYAGQAGLGFTSVTASFSSNGTGDLAAYKLGSSAIAVNAEGSMLYATSPSLAVGGLVSYDLARSTPGVRYSDGTSTVNIPFSIHRVTLGATAAKHLGQLVLSGVLGFRFEKFVVNNVGDPQKNLAKLPTELFTGAILGAELALPKLTDTMAVAASAHLLVVGSRKQTAGLEDGQVSGAGGFDIGLRGTYQLKKLSLFGGYTLDRRNTNWQGAAPGSMRGHNATAATRADTWHTLIVGVAAQY